MPAERAVPAVQRAQEPVAAECGRGEHEQLVPVPEEVAVPQAPPRRRRHPRKSVHGHDSQDLQRVLHVSGRASEREPSSVPPAATSPTYTCLPRSDRNDCERE